MKTKTLLAVGIGLALVGMGWAQQWPMSPVIGYGQPMVYPLQQAYMPMVVQADQLAGGTGFVPAGLVSEEAADVATGTEPGSSDGQCSGDGSCGSPDCCCGPVWTVYADFLYLRPRNKELALVAPIDGAEVQDPSYPIQIGPIGVLDPDFEPGFRVGFYRWINESASIGAEYTWFESQTETSAAISAPNVLRSLVRHPGTAAAPSDFLQAWGGYDIDFQIIDINYRVSLWSGVRHDVTLVAGGTYVNETQTFLSRFEDSGVETVNTDLVFDGGGIRVGLEAERHSLRTGLTAYGRASARFVGGEFRGTYLQGTGTDPVIVNTRWSAGRVVSILDIELGLGWVSSNGCLRFTAGYMFSGWFNTVNTDEWIQAVQNNNFVGLSDSLAFDGLVGRVEARW